MVKKKLKLLVLITCSVFAGCASFEPGLRFQDLNRPRQPSARAVQEGLEISVEEFITPAKSQMIFDTDLAANGVLAILVKAENGGTEKYSVRREDMQASLNGQSLTHLAPREAANEAATSEYVGKALGWTVATGPFAILLWPVTIGASSVHTHGVNKKIEQYFEGTSYQDALLGPKQTSLGFVYFKLPDDVETLENFTIETTASMDGSDKKLSYEFSLPSLKLEK